MTSFGLLILLAVAAYLVAFLFDTMLRWFTFVPYMNCMASSGIHIGVLQVKWYTTSLNRLFSRMGTWRPSLLRLWFVVGAWVSAILIIPAMVLLVRTLIANIVLLANYDDDSGTKSKDQIVLQPVVPGNDSHKSVKEIISIMIFFLHRHQLASWRAGILLYHPTSLQCDPRSRSCSFRSQSRCQGPWIRDVCPFHTSSGLCRSPHRPALGSKTIQTATGVCCRCLA